MQLLKDKERLLNAARKSSSRIERSSVRLIQVLIRNYGGQKTVGSQYSKSWKKDGQERIKFRNLSSENEIKIFPEKNSNFIANRPALQEILMGFLKAEMKGHGAATWIHMKK